MCHHGSLACRRSYSLFILLRKDTPRECYTFGTPRALLFKARGSLSRVCYTLACRSPPEPFCSRQGVLSPEYFSSIPLSISFQCEGRSEGCSRAGANSVLATRVCLPVDPISRTKDSELVDSQESVDADCKSLTHVLQSKRTVRTNRNGFTGFACLREFPKGTMRL